jgi:hypothetical protein
VNVWAPAILVLAILPPRSRVGYYGWTVRRDARAAAVQPRRIRSAVQSDHAVVRTNYYPAWQARVGDAPVSLYASDGQLSFHAPASGSYMVRLDYPRRRWLSLIALTVFVCGLYVLSRWPGQ